MTAFIDITGKKYGMLTVIRRLENAPKGVVRWECKCDCGNVVIVRSGNLKNGAVKSCGCLRKDIGKKVRHMVCLKHGFTRRGLISGKDVVARIILHTAYMAVGE